MRNPVTSQTVHSECPRPQPREAKTVSHLEQSIMTRGTFRMNLIQPSKRNRKKTTSGKKKPKPGGTTRRTWPLDQGKRLRKQFREELMQGRLRGRAVCLEAMKKYPHASKWQDIKDKIRNMTISDARK